MTEQNPERDPRSEFEDRGFGETREGASQQNPTEGQQPDMSPEGGLGHEEQMSGESRGSDIGEQAQAGGMGRETQEGPETQGMTSGSEDLGDRETPAGDERMAEDTGDVEPGTEASERGPSAGEYSGDEPMRTSEGEEDRP